MEMDLLCNDPVRYSGLAKFQLGMIWDGLEIGSGYKILPKEYVN